MMVTGWWGRNGSDATWIACWLLCIFIGITVGVWLFCDKITTECHAGEKLVVNETFSNGAWAYYELQNDPCAWTTETHSHYTLIESIGAEYSWLSSVLGGFAGWVGEHRVV
jgi:hypothetical protein